MRAKCGKEQVRLSPAGLVSHRQRAPWDTSPAGLIVAIRGESGSPVIPMINTLFLKGARHEGFGTVPRSREESEALATE